MKRFLGILLIAAIGIMLGITMLYSYFQLFYKDGVKYEPIVIDEKFEILNPGDSFLIKISRCSTHDYSIAIDSYLVHNVKTDNEAGSAEEQIFLNHVDATIKKGCRQDFVGVERTLPKTIEPGVYYVRNEATYIIRWMLFEKLETVIFESNTFRVVKGTIGDTGATEQGDYK